MRLSKTTAITFLICAVALVLGCGPGQAGDGRGGPTPDVPDAQTATVAGGCFWCVESAFDGVPGVIHAISGYTGGESKDPTYEQVSSGRSGHVEAVEIRFDPDIISYEEVLDIFWRQIDPTDPGGQFADRGSQYQTYIFTHDEQQAEIARRTKAELGASGRFGAPIVTEIVPAKTFYPAEDYHQDYHLKQPERYKRYAYGSGRIPFLQRVWGDAKPSKARSKPSSRGAGFDEATFVKPTDEQLREMLDPLQYQVTQEEGTERAFTNEYWNNKGEGIYVDIVSGEPLFSSTDKYASGSGWPAFTRPLEPDNIVEKIDHKMYVPRTEVRSKHADSHLGHVFDDGPQPTGLRYCINSAALRFIPKKDLEREGYGEYLKLFESSGKH